MCAGARTPFGKHCIALGTEASDAQGGGPGMPALSATSPTGCVCVCNDKGSGHKVIFLLRVILLINSQLAGILLY